MTVSELIERLEKLPKESTVRVATYNPTEDQPYMSRIPEIAVDGDLVDIWGET